MKNYLLVTKPGIIAGNTLATLGGFFLASKGSVDMVLLCATLLGVALVVASGCVFNNYIDRDIDRLMTRTKHRVLAQDRMSPVMALSYGGVLALFGFTLLWLYTPLLAVGFALFGFAIYVGFYTLWLKRKSVHGTLVGSLSGAAPPVIGYCAVSNHFDMAAALLLLLFSLWQMPHSYAIAIFRYRDYVNASIPVLPLKRGIHAAKKQIAFYIVGFIAAALALSLNGHTGYGFLVVTCAVGFSWLAMALSGFSRIDSQIWARNVFIFSLFAITTLSIMMSMDYSATAVSEARRTLVWR